MAFDGFVTHCMAEEWRKNILGGKVDKIYQPERDEIIMTVRTPNGNFRLLLSASASNARTNFTQESRENPMTPPMFCMLLRKHLSGGKIINITQHGFDRVLRLEIESYTELGDLTSKYLIIEIMGRHSNVILTDADSKILDSAKHIDFTVSAVRQILPGLIYELPPAQDKREPMEMTAEEISAVLTAQTDEVLLDGWLVSSFIGMSPLIAREIVYRFCGNTKAAIHEVEIGTFARHTAEFFRAIAEGKYSPCVVLENRSGKPLAFSCVTLTQYEDSAQAKEMPSMSEAVEYFFSTRSLQERLKQKSASLVKLIHNNIDRCEKKLALHRDNLKKSQNREKYKIYGDLLTANLYRVEYGMDSVEVENYYSAEQETVKISLKAELSPAQNAQNYYKRYNKAKTTEKYALEQIKDAEEELYYLETVLDAVLKAETPVTFAEIREELAQQGYLPQVKNNKKNTARSKPNQFRSSDGYEILVGRNNRQNDELTLRMAYSTDIWLHTKIIPGSHTIIRTRGEETVPDTTILEAARLAAYFSKAQNSAQVPVDYTAVKNVKKPNGAKPGMVIYDRYNTVYVQPDAEVVKALSKQDE